MLVVYIVCVSFSQICHTLCDLLTPPWFWWRHANFTTTFCGAYLNFMEVLFQKKNHSPSSKKFHSRPPFKRKSLPSDACTSCSNHTPGKASSTLALSPSAKATLSRIAGPGEDLTRIGTEPSDARGFPLPRDGNPSGYSIVQALKNVRILMVTSASILGRGFHSHTKIHITITGKTSVIWKMHNANVARMVIYEIAGEVRSNSFILATQRVQKGNEDVCSPFQLLTLFNGCSCFLVPVKGGRWQVVYKW